jgi:hypothetical protein
MSTLDPKCQALALDVKPLALKVDIYDLHAVPNTRRWTFPASERAKVDTDLAVATRFWHP